jgi:hypothetical protein
MLTTTSVAQHARPVPAAAAAVCVLHVCCCWSHAAAAAAAAASESELLSLLQDRLSVLRLPTELMDSKLACARSLALLNPRWMADFQVGWGFGHRVWQTLSSVTCLF